MLSDNAEKLLTWLYASVPKKQIVFHSDLILSVVTQYCMNMHGIFFKQTSLHLFSL